MARLRQVDSILDVPAATWDGLCGSGQPFIRHGFLAALEASGSVGESHGWVPAHCLLENDDGEAIAAAPLYEKHHSYGEFVFDFAWANAYAQVGLDYYPKLLNAVPFTPVSGPRILGRDEEARLALARAMASEGAAPAERTGLSFTEEDAPARAPAAPSVATTPQGGAAPLSWLSFALLLLLLAAGVTGTRDPLLNPLPIAIWTGLWVALVLTYWVLALPHRVGMTTAWVLGLAQDVLELVDLDDESKLAGESVGPHLACAAAINAAC